MQRRILVTGAGARIGQALSIELAKAGWQVLVHYHSSLAGASQTCAKIEEIGGTGHLVQADLSDHQQCMDLIPDLVTRFGPIHGLVNNASIFENDQLDNLEPSQWERQFAINLKAPIFLSQSFAAQLPKGEHGHVINLLDQRLAKLNPTFFSYTLSKAALGTATTTMAQALAPDIQVNAVAPGPSLRNARQSEADFAAQQQACLLGAGSPPQDIIRAVLFLLANRSVTGQTITVDGGQHLIWQTSDVIEGD